VEQVCARRRSGLQKRDRCGDRARVALADGRCESRNIVWALSPGPGWQGGGTCKRRSRGG
jgi:hypothetical protein